MRRQGRDRMVEMNQNNAVGRNCCRLEYWSRRVLPAIILLMGGVISNVAAASAASAQLSASPGLETGTDATTGLPAPATHLKTGERTQGTCQPQEARNIVVCGQRREGFRLDPDVMEAKREVETDSRSASSKVPTAQAACSPQPMGCGKSLDSFDLANVAIVLGTSAIRAAKGEVWTKAFKTGGPDEYQQYQQAKQRRKAQDAGLAAVRLRLIARQEERQSAAAHAASQ